MKSDRSTRFEFIKNLKTWDSDMLLRFKNHVFILMCPACFELDGATKGQVVEGTVWAPSYQRANKIDSVEGFWEFVDDDLGGERLTVVRGKIIEMDEFSDFVVDSDGLIVDFESNNDPVAKGLKVGDLVEVELVGKCHLQTKGVGNNEK